MDKFYYQNRLYHGTICESRTEAQQLVQELARNWGYKNSKALNLSIVKTDCGNYAAISTNS